MDRSTQANGSSRFLAAVAWLAFLGVWWGTGTGGAAARAADVLVEAGSPMKYLANSVDPGIGLGWTAEAFDDSSWPAGSYGVGYESGTGAQNLISTPVPAGSFSVYTRVAFTVVDVSAVSNLFLGADYDDGYVAWINGVEVFRSLEMPAGGPSWNTNSALHESSNAATPNYAPLQDVSAAGIPALQNGQNTLAIGVWNSNAPGSSDLVLVPRLSANESNAVTRGPYLQLGTPESVVVRWRTQTPTDSRVRYGDAPGNLTSFADDGAATTEHVVTVSGLSPDTAYYYSVGSTDETLAGDDPDHVFVTSPAAGTPKPIRVWVLGDSGTADANAAAVRDAYYTFAGSVRTDLWLMLGDNAYPDGTDSQHQSAVFDMYPEILRTSVLWPTLGNHDGHTADSATQTGPYYDIFSLPAAAQAGGVASGTEAYYSFDHGNVHFVCLESYETDRSGGGAMLTWLEQDLAATTQDWIIAFWHHPPYSKGSHNSDNEIELQEMRENALPILEDGGVDLVLTGHSHSYERSFLIDGHHGTSGTFTESMKLDGGSGRTDGDGAYEKPALGPDPHRGAVYIVAGSSGQTSGGALNHPAMFISLNRLGSVVLDLNGDTLDVKFLDDGGVFSDYFTIIKGTGMPPLEPSGLIATTVSSSQINLDWVDGSDDESGFEVERSLDGSAWTLAATVGQNQETYADTGLAASTTYFYRVRAFNGLGPSPYSNTASDTTLEAGTAIDVASGEIAVAGTVTGTHADTQLADLVYESIEERESGGRPANRHSYLEHKWTVDVTGGDTVTFFLKAFRTASTDGDAFVFAYSTDDVSYADMVTVTKTADDGMYQSFGLPLSASGTVFIRVRDTDQTPGNRALDTVFVDDMFVRSEPSQPVPPVAPSDLAAVAVSSSRIDLFWSDSSGNEDGFRVERSLDGSAWSPVATVGPGVTSHADTGLSPSTAYLYRVAAFNVFGDSPYSNSSGATTLPAGAVDDTAFADLAVSGTVGGSFLDTRASDGVSESITERESGGKPANRHSFLEHKWTVNVTGGSAVTFHLEAYRTDSGEGDAFIFAYSTDDASYTDMVTVTKTADDDTYQTFSLPSDLSGTVYIRVLDADQTQGNRALDTVFVDHLFVRSE